MFNLTFAGSKNKIAIVTDFVFWKSIKTFFLKANIIIAVREVF